MRQLHGKTGTMARFLARVVGTIIPMGLGIEPVSRLWTRRIYANISQASAWDRPLTLASDALRGLEFWGNCFEKFRGQPIWTVDPIYSVTSCSDSSEYGWGRYTVNISSLSAKGNFSVGEARIDSMWRVLKGTFNVLCSSVKSMEGRKVRHRIDNQNVVRALTNESQKQHSQVVTMDIFKLYIENNISLFPDWVPGSPNETADWIWNDLDKDDYMLNLDISAAADILWGPHTIDRFSSFKTRQSQDSATDS